jgi:hypothetical protein
MLDVTFDGGEFRAIDLLQIVETRSALAPLRGESVFSQVRVSDVGWSVAWPGEVVFGAPGLRRWADEQAGRFMPAALFCEWMARLDLTLDRAAVALGLLRRMMACYSSGKDDPEDGVVGDGRRGCAVRCVSV